MILKHLKRAARKHRGMIAPGLGSTYDSAMDIYRRKGAHMVYYLRARRDVTDITNPRPARLKGVEWKAFHRRSYFCGQRKP